MRWGPSIFIHGPDVLIDTPEEIAVQLARSSVSHIRACFYSHWHPDHVMGRRIWEYNKILRTWPLSEKKEPVPVYLPQGVARDFKRRYDLWAYFSLLQDQGLVKIHVVKDSEHVLINGYKFSPFVLGESGIYGFGVSGSGQEIAVVPDELFGWKPSSDLKGSLNVAILPAGVFEFHPLSGERLIDPSHPVLKNEATFEQTLEVARTLGAKRTYLTHIEEVDPITFDELEKIAQMSSTRHVSIQFAHDTLRVKL